MEREFRKQKMEKHGKRERGGREVKLKSEKWRKKLVEMERKRIYSKRVKRDKGGGMRGWRRQKQV